MTALWWGIAVGVPMLAVVAVGWGFTRRRLRRIRLAQARHGFHAQREWLEAKFIQRAAASTAPDTLRWADCTFDDDVAYVQSRSTGELSALVAVTIASETSDHEARGKTDAVGNLQAGTAVFRFDGQHWVTDGRAILNLSPWETIQRFHGDLQMVAEEPAHRTNCTT